MTGVEEVRARVAASYDRLGLPSWPDPHPDMTEPAEEDYSRVTDPGRYAVVHARGRAWAARLGDLPGVTVTTLPPGPLDEDGDRGLFARGVRVTSPRAGTLPLLLLERDVPQEDGSLAVLHISVIRPEVEVCSAPTCGCDACDHGSDELLDAVDTAVATVVGGPSVWLRGRGWSASWHPQGGSMTGGRRLPRFDRVMGWCRRLAGGEDVALPRGTSAFVGHSWFA